MWLEAKSKSLAYVLYFISFALFSAYNIYCHGRYGKTLGKYSMGIGLVQVDGERISWRQAWLRSSVDIGFGILSVVVECIALWNITDTQFYNSTWLERAEYMAEQTPAWSNWIMISAQIWIWSEVVVMLFNEKRRALHDFIAGTVVVSNEMSPSWPQFSK